MEYATYKPELRIRIGWGCMFLLLSLLLGRLFYGRFLAGLIGLLAMPYFLKQKTEEIREKRRQLLLVEFKDLILAYSNALKAGYSIENGFREAYKDMGWQYQKDDLIMCECRLIIARMENKHSLEEQLIELGKRSGLEDILDFASVFSVAGKSGGNLSAIIADTGMKISDKLAVMEEIRLMFASKRFEQQIMNCIPIFIMCYIGLGTPDYFDPLYGNPTGIAIMSAGLVLYAAAYYLGKKITDIRV